MINTSKLTDTLRDAISDYAVHAEEKAPAEWLQGYLGEKLPDKSVDTIHTIANGIISSIDIMEERKAALNAALESGVSAENWFTNDIMKETAGNGEKARMAAEFLNGITTAEQTYDSTINSEVIDIEAENWSDDEWNEYRLKDSLKSVAMEAGKTGLREISSEVFQKAAEEGVEAVFEDSEFVINSIEKGAVTGLKAAVSAGLTIAQEKDIIPPTALEVIAATAHRTVESIAVFSDVIRGRKTITEAIVEVKNTAVSTFSAMWKKCGSCVISEAKKMITDAFGVKGAVITGAITGLITPPQEGSKLKHVLKETGKAVLSFLTKERHLPFFNKNKNKQLAMN
jgi:hypothetical protein